MAPPRPPCWPRAIFEEGLRNLTLGANPTIIRRGIDKAVEAAVAKLNSLAKPVESKSQIAQVGAISANNDMEIGNLIADAMEKVGRRWRDYRGRGQERQHHA